MHDAMKRYSYTIFGYFLGNRILFPKVDHYVGNVWKKYGLEKAMMTATGFYYFKYASEDGMIRVLEEGPWLIRNIPIILKLWSSEINITKEDVTSVPVWIKMHMFLLLVTRMMGLVL